MSDRKKVVSRPGGFRAGDIVQTIPEGTRFEIVTTRAGSSGTEMGSVFRVRPAWTEDLPFPKDRDHVVEREPDYVASRRPTTAPASAQALIEEIESLCAEDGSVTASTVGDLIEAWKRAS